MTARHRQASGSTAASVRAEPSAADRSVNGQAALSLWEQWFAGASADQRNEALALARQQGLLYLHQLPAVAAGPRQAAPLVPVLTRLLSGKIEPATPLADDPVICSDPQLDPLQREAVRRALNTPDLCLLSGLPGTGKTRVVSEVIIQAARRGWRVLLLAPTAPAVDIILDRLAGCPDILPIRMLREDESAEALPPHVRGLTLAQQRKAVRDRTHDGARRARQQTEETCQKRRREESLWPEMLSIAGRHAALSDRLNALRRRQAEAAGEVEREASGLPFVNKGLPSGPFAAELVELHKRSGAAQAEWQAARQTLEAKRDTVRKLLEAMFLRLTSVEAKCRARQERRWWTLAYWTGGSALAQRDALRAEQGRAESELRGLDEALAELDAGRRQAEETEKAEWQSVIAGEIGRRRQELSAEAAGPQQEIGGLDRKWHSLCGELDPAELRPSQPQPSEVEAARQRWLEHCRLDEERCRFARQWADYLDRAGDELLPRLPALANLIAGTTTALGRCREWSEAQRPGFDLLVLEEADSLTESDLARFAAHAPRLLLAGQSLAEPMAMGPPPRAPQDVRPLGGCWGRLWEALGDDLGRLPYTWQREGDRLVCNLAAVRSEDARYIEREGLADAPEIELSILNLPRSRPVLARVSFPGRFSIPQATAHIYRELQELPIQPLGRTAWWEETAQSLVLHLAPSPPAATECVELADGVQMDLVGDGQAYSGRAASLRFARLNGWDRPGTRRWLQEHLHFGDRERAVFLQVPYRMHRPLADVVGPMLFPDACLGKLLGGPAAERPFEFVAVPPPRRAELPREGAGFEQDLASGRLGDRLPTELRGELPRKGIVNYLEAQALIRRLEQWAQAPGELSGNGQRAPSEAAPAPSVLVLALYEAQAELLRHLAARSTALQARSFQLEIAVPNQARHRECDVLVLSLTRSHAHRCVPFGENAADLAVAMTRPRERLLIFGDLGTLVKRTHWHGPLDHLDALTARQEGLRLGRLLQHLQSL
jgi:hypothetical protein